MNSGFYRTSFFTTAGLLLLAIGEMPYGFYEALRLLVPIAGVLVVLRSVKERRHGWVVLGALSIVFFLPVFGVYLDKQTWAWFDAAFAISYIAAAVHLGKK